MVLTSPPFAYTVLLRLDSAGACPVILSEDSEPLSGEEGVRYRFVAQTDDHGEGIRVGELLGRWCDAGLGQGESGKLARKTTGGTPTVPSRA